MNKIDAIQSTIQTYLTSHKNSSSEISRENQQIYQLAINIINEQQDLSILDEKNLESLYLEMKEKLYINETQLPDNTISLTIKSPLEDQGPNGKYWNRTKTVQDGEDLYYIFEPVVSNYKEINLFPADEWYKNGIFLINDVNNLNFLQKLGIEIYSNNDSIESLKLPARETLLRNWKKLQKEWPNLEDLDLVESHGIASDELFVNTVLSGKLILDAGEEFIHDYQIHIIPTMIALMNHQIHQNNKSQLINQELDRLESKNIKLYDGTIPPDLGRNELNEKIDIIISNLKRSEKIPSGIKKLLILRFSAFKGEIELIKTVISQLEKKISTHEKSNKYHSVILGICTDTIVGRDLSSKVVSQKTWDAFNMVFNQNILTLFELEVFKRPNWFNYLKQRFPDDTVDMGSLLNELIARCSRWN